MAGWGVFKVASRDVMLLGMLHGEMDLRVKDYKGHGIIAGVFLLSALLLSSASVLAAEKLVLAVHPYKTTSALIKAFSPLADYLSQKLNIDVSLEISTSYQSHLDRLGKNKVDIAYLGPASYVLLVDEFGDKPILARQLINDQSFFQGKIITRHDSSIVSLQGLQGKRFAFGDSASTMSHLVPRYMLIKAGIGSEKLSDHQFLGSHDNVAMGVLSGDFDAGAVKEAVFYKYQSRGLKELATTPPIPEHLFVARSDLAVEKVTVLRQVLLDLNGSEDGRLVLTSIKKTITALESAADADYDVLREIFSVLSKNGIQP